jgi:hypothetical protein
VTSSELRQIRPITRRDKVLDVLRVYFRDRLIGVVAHVRVPNGSGRMCWRWEARVNALAEPLPGYYLSKDAAMAALLSARNEGDAR